MSRIAEMKERIRAHQGDKADRQVVQAAKASTALIGRTRSDYTKAKMQQSADHTGARNSKYGTGVLYIETTSNFIGTWYDLHQQFGKGDYIYFAKKGNLITKGRHVGKQFKIYQP